MRAWLLERAIDPALPPSLPSVLASQLSQAIVNFALVGAKLHLPFGCLPTQSGEALWSTSQSVLVFTILNSWVSTANLATSLLTPHSSSFTNKLKSSEGGQWGSNTGPRGTPLPSFPYTMQTTHFSLLPASCS